MTLASLKRACSQQFWTQKGFTAFQRSLRLSNIVKPFCCKALRAVKFWIWNCGYRDATSLTKQLVLKSLKFLPVVPKRLFPAVKPLAANIYSRLKVHSSQRVTLSLRERAFHPSHQHSKDWRSPPSDTIYLSWALSCSLLHTVYCIGHRLTIIYDF